MYSPREIPDIAKTLGVYKHQYPTNSHLNYVKKQGYESLTEEVSPSEKFINSDKVLDEDSNIIAIDCVQIIRVNPKCTQTPGKCCSHHVTLEFDDHIVKVVNMNASQIVILLNHLGIEDPHFKPMGNFRENFASHGDLRFANREEVDKILPAGNPEVEEGSEDTSRSSIWQLLLDLFCKRKVKNS